MEEDEIELYAPDLVSCMIEVSKVTTKDYYWH